jgi:hypothetical protein
LAIERGSGVSTGTGTIAAPTAALTSFEASGGISATNVQDALEELDSEVVRSAQLGTMATQSAGSVNITGGTVTGITDLAVADGGTGASTAAAAATNLGLGTGNSPQFTAVNIGDATDTTLARSSAGNLSVEGNLLYRAGGTDVPVADGGTGVSSLTAYSVICGGTTSTNPVQSVASVGTSGQVLTSNGAGALPTFQASSGATMGTPVASTSGTSIDFTGIPSTATQIAITFAGVSVSGIGAFIIQIGKSGGVETSSYVSSIQVNGGTLNQETAGFAINNFTSATVAISGTATLTLHNLSTNTWVISGVLGRDDAAGVLVFGGKKSLAGTLDRVRVTTVAGTDTFDAGSINIRYS